MLGRNAIGDGSCNSIMCSWVKCGVLLENGIRFKSEDIIGFEMCFLNINIQKTEVLML